MPNYIGQLRQSLGAYAEDKTDEQLLEAVAHSTGRNPAQVADDYGYLPTTNGQWGNRVAGSINNYVSNLQDVGAQVTGGLPGVSDWLDRRRQANSFMADVERGRAQSQGAVMSMKDINGVGSAANWLGGLAVDSAPYLGEAALGGGAATLAARSLRAGAGATRAAQLASVPVVSYPSSVGDILNNQREQAGTVDNASAFGYGVPYAALNAFNPLERSVATRTLPRLLGGEGVAGRMLKTGGATALEEGGNELGQEFANQAGRMNVDPNATFWSQDAQQRYLESFVGGAALGGVFGGLSGIRRHPEGPSVPPPGGSSDLLEPPPPQSPLLLPYYDPDPFIAGPDGSVGKRSDFANYANLSQGFYPADRSLPYDPNTPFPPAPPGGAPPYEGGIPFNEPPQGPMPGERPNFQMPTVTGQESLFGTEPLAQNEQGAPETPGRQSYAGQRDMFNETPSAIVAAGDAYTPANIASQIVQRTQGPRDAYTVKLAIDLSRNLSDPTTYLAERTSQNEKALEKLNKQVDQESNVLTPEEYAQKRAVLERRSRAIEAAADIADRYKAAYAQALSDENGGTKPREAVMSQTPATIPVSEVSNAAAPISGAQSVAVASPVEQSNLGVGSAGTPAASGRPKESVQRSRGPRPPSGSGGAVVANGRGASEQAAAVTAKPYAEHDGKTVEIETPTGATKTVKDAGKTLREADRRIDRLNEFLKCLTKK